MNITIKYEMGAEENSWLHNSPNKRNSYNIYIANYNYYNYNKLGLIIPNIGKRSNFNNTPINILPVSNKSYTNTKLPIPVQITQKDEMNNWSEEFLIEELIGELCQFVNDCEENICPDIDEYKRIYTHFIHKNYGSKFNITSTMVPSITLLEQICQYKFPLLMIFNDNPPHQINEETFLLNISLLEEIIFSLWNQTSKEYIPEYIMRKKRDKINGSHATVKILESKSSPSHSVPGTPSTHSVPNSPSTHLVPNSPSNHLVPKSPLNHLIPNSPSTHLVPKSPSNHLVPKSPLNNLIPKSPSTHLVSKSPSTHLVPKSPSTHSVSKSPSSYLVPKSPSNDLVPSTPSN